MLTAPVDLDPIVARHVEAFHEARRERIGRIRVRDLLRKKNPYLFLARGVSAPRDLARVLVDATLSSSEETMFGQTLEDIAVDVCEAAFGGRKSTATGIDLEFERDGTRYLVAIKSGPGWGNSSQVAKMREDFLRAIRVVRQGRRRIDVQAINGCCYGTPDTDRGDYRKVCGAAFWELVSGEPDLYARLAVALRDAAANGHAAAIEGVTERIADELADGWCDGAGCLDWPRIVAANAARSRVERGYG